MESRICARCGQDFVSESFMEEIFPATTIIAVFLAYECIRLGGWAWLGAGFCLMSAFGTILIKLDNRKMKRGRQVCRGRECPSCGDKSVDSKSPLGKQVARKWAEAEKEQLLEDVDGSPRLTAAVDEK